MTVDDMPTLAAFISHALDGSPEAIADEVTSWRGQFREVHFTTDNPT